MAIATLTSKHQITIPKAIRPQMNLREGDRIEFLSNAAKAERRNQGIWLSLVTMMETAWVLSA